MEEPASELYEFPPLHTKEDLAQETALATLEGRRPPSRYHRVSSSQKSREYGYGLLPEDSAVSVFCPTPPDPHVIETIIQWTMAQSRNIAVKVLNYLENPDDTLLQNIREMVDCKVEIQAYGRSTSTLTDLILRALPASPEQLYALARQEHRSRRPEAAVRQTLRNLQRRKVITCTEGVWNRA